MNGQVPAEIESRLQQTGVAAWGVRTWDGNLYQRSYAVWLSTAQIEQTIARLVLAAESLQYQQLHPKRICWIFANLRLYLASRGDGSSLVLFVENRPELPVVETHTILDEWIGGASTDTDRFENARTSNSGLQNPEQAPDPIPNIAPL